MQIHVRGGRGKEKEGQNVKRVNRRVWVTQVCLSFMWTFGCGLRFTGQILWLWAQPWADGRREWLTGHHLHPPLIWRHITLSRFYAKGAHYVSESPYIWLMAQGSVRNNFETISSSVIRVLISIQQYPTKSKISNQTILALSLNYYMSNSDQMTSNSWTFMKTCSQMILPDTSL